jgi:hypothetical protein
MLQIQEEIEITSWKVRAYDDFIHEIVVKYIKTKERVFVARIPNVLSLEKQGSV